MAKIKTRAWRKELIQRTLQQELRAQPQYTPTGRTASKGFRPGDPETSLPVAKTVARV